MDFHGSKFTEEKNSVKHQIDVTKHLCNTVLRVIIIF